MAYKKKKKNEDEYKGTEVGNPDNMFPDADDMKAKKKALKDLLKKTKRG